MKFIPREVFPYFISIVFILMTVAAGRPLMSLYAESLGASMIEIGLLTVCYSILPLCFAVSIGALIDRWGSKRPVILGSIGMGSAMIIVFLIPHLAGLYLSQLLLGISQLICVVALQAGVGGSSSSGGRDKMIGNFSLFASLGLLIGPVLGGYATEHLGFRYAYLITGILAFIPAISVIGLSNRKRSEKEEAPQSKGVRARWRETRQLLSIPALGRTIGVSLFIIASIDIFQVYFPLYGQSLGMSSSQIGWLLSSQAAAAMFIRLFLSPLVKRMGRVNVLWMFMAAGAIAYGLLSVSHQFSVILLLCMLLGMGLGICQPLTIVMTYNTAAAGHIGEALAVRLAGNRLGQVVLPFVMAGISQFAGLGVIFALQSVFLLFGVWLAKGIKLES